jgi:membrane-bound lytic murein transglycosylase B
MFNFILTLSSAMCHIYNVTREQIITFLEIITNTNVGSHVQITEELENIIG